MPQLQSVVLTDRESTPVAHTFTPTRLADDVAVLYEHTGTPIADPQYSISTRRTPDNIKVVIKLDEPSVQTETVNGVDYPKIVHTLRGKQEFTFPLTSTEAERNNFVGKFMSGLSTSTTLANDTLVKGEGIW